MFDPIYHRIENITEYCKNLQHTILIEVNNYLHKNIKMENMVNGT